MSTHTHAHSTNSSSSPSLTETKSSLLPRNCACGGSSGLSGGCKACAEKRLSDRGTTAIVRDPFSSPVDSAAHTGGVRKSSVSHDFSQVTVHAPQRSANTSSTRMSGGLQEVASEDEETFIGGNGRDSGTTSYAESNELLECIRIMGQENAEYCREQARDPANRAPHSARVATTSDTAGPPAFTPCGRFVWHVGFSTSGRNGVLVQEIINTYQVQSCAGVAIPNGPTPRYYEAWKVDAAGAVTPNVGATNDMWERPVRPNTKGSWSMTGNVHWAANMEPAAGFGVGNVPDAGPILMSTLKRPTNIANPILTRTKGGSWDCCGGSNTHTPK